MRNRIYRDRNVRVKAMSLFGIRPIFYVFSILLAGLCLMRVFAVPANAASVDATVDEIEESYEGSSSKIDSADDEQGEDYGRIDVRLTKPNEAEKRVDESDGYALVPGAEKIVSLNTVEDLEKAAAVKEEDSRAPASAASKSEKHLSQEDTIGLIVPARPRQRFSTESTPGTLEQAPAEGGATTPPDFALNEEPRAVKPGMYQEVSIIVSDYGYFPSRVFVTQNIPVKMYLSTPSKSTLCMMIDTWGVKKGIQPGKVEELGFVPDSPGNFRFYCPVKGIEGTLTVRAARTPGEPGRNVATKASEHAGYSRSGGNGSGGYSPGRAIASSSRGGKFSQEEQSVKSSQKYLKEENTRSHYNEPKNANELRALVTEE